ncbi:MAG: VWA domain-containing protein [Acidobacteriota bacterium]|nr:VWA domain-containing protein [Acidobacteriota bacterium]
MKRKLAIFCCLAALAQERQFRTGIRVVQVPVTVTNESGGHVDGLKPGDFQVLDNGEPRQVTLDTFGRGFAPISLAIAVQTSGLSKPAVAKIRRIGSLIVPLVIGRRGEAAILTFDDEIQWRQDFTSDTASIQKAIRAIQTGESKQGHMLDTVVDVASAMKERKGRRVLLLISESRDRGSKAKLEDAVQAVEREGVEVFAATYSAQATTWTAQPEDLPPPSGANYLAVFTEMARLGKTNHASALTQATGGAQYPFLRERTIEKAIETLGVDVHAQYILSFPEPADAAGMHEIAVSMPNRTDLHIRARRAYCAESGVP